MEWMIHAIVVWMVFAFLVRWSELKVTIWCGLLSVALQMAIDSFSFNNGFYKVTNPVISIWGSSIFFILGPALSLGILFAQFHPRKKWAKIILIFFFVTAFSIEEMLINARNGLVYLNWNIYYSVFINFLTFITMSWFSIVVLNRGVEKG